MQVSPEDAERIRQAEDGDVVELTGAPLINPELDLAVAKAIGLKIAVLHNGKVLITPREWDEIRGIEHLTCEGSVACISFLPSVDLNAAFAAAEKVGLWNRSEVDEMMSLTKDDGQWHMQCCEWHRTASTPALAICAAILKLKEKKE